MPDYKRKKVKKSFLCKKVSNKPSSEIIMKNSKQKSIVPENDIKVVRGARYKRKQLNKFLLITITAIASICLLLSAILPVGLYENVVNSIAVMGHGKYPIEFSGSTTLNTISNGSYYFILSDTSIFAFSNNGKTIFSDMHGFSNPVMYVSDTRVMVFDQGGKKLNVYNLSGMIHSFETEKEIITANISRNGYYAVATHSDSYTSVVDVYNNDFEKIFTWNSAKDIINNVLVSDKGNKIAVSTLNAIAGQYNSKFYILNYESADPIHSLELGNSVALSLVNTGKGVSVITKDKYKFVHWTKFTSNEITVSGEINIIRKNKNGLLLVSNRANDRGDNNVVLVSNKGEKTSEFKFNEIITDIQHAKGRVYCVSDTIVRIYDSAGNILRYSNCNYGTKKIAVIAPNDIATVSDTEIVKINIEKGVD